MDSTLTLVNPTPITLSFNKDSLRNAILSVSGLPLYQLSTPDRKQMHTEVRDLHNDELVFVIKQRDFLPDCITFTGVASGGYGRCEGEGGERGKGKERTVNLKNWLKKGGDSGGDGRTMYILETEYGVYHWKVDPVHRLVASTKHHPQQTSPNSSSPQLYPSSDHTQPLARMIQGPRPSLWIDAGTEQFRDQILASFMIIEREMRGKEARYKAFLRDSRTQAALALGNTLG